MSEFNDRIKAIEKKVSETRQLADEHLQESERLIRIAHNSRQILDDIDEEFERTTELKPLDIIFLFTAIALQITRQFFVTRFPERVDDKSAADDTMFHTEEHSDRKHRYYNPSAREIITNPVPFDANIGANGALSGGGEMGHRVTALGHDPVVGLLIGTANIATSTLTNNRLESFHIYTNDNKRDFFKAKADTITVLSKTKEKLLSQGTKGKTIVGLSLFKELVHLKSDIKTKRSLPLPFVSLFSGEEAAYLAVQRGLDAANISNVAKQSMYSTLINFLIGCVHGLFYDESIDSRKLYDVRTRKILLYSNAIASFSNMAFVEANMILGNEAAVRKLDIGGLLVTLRRITTDPNVIREIKYEFLTNQFIDRING